jgi:hypothetical protein
MPFRRFTLGTLERDRIGTRRVAFMDVTMRETMNTVVRRKIAIVPPDPEHLLSLVGGFARRRAQRTSRVEYTESAAGKLVDDFQIDEASAHAAPPPRGAACIGRHFSLCEAAVFSPENLFCRAPGSPAPVFAFEGAIHAASLPLRKRRSKAGRGMSTKRPSLMDGISPRAMAS